MSEYEPGTEQNPLPHEPFNRYTKAFNGVAYSPDTGKWHQAPLGTAPSAKCMRCGNEHAANAVDVAMYCAAVAEVEYVHGWPKRIRYKSHDEMYGTGKPR